MAGTFLVLVALLGIYLTRTLSGATDVGLGPGFIPRMFAFAQIVLGGLLVASGWRSAPDPADETDQWQLRPVLLVLAAVGFFGVSIEPLGLVLSVAGLVLIGCAANRDCTVKESVALAIGLTIFAAVVFVKILGLTIKLWP